MSGKVSDNLGRSSGLIKAASAAAGGTSWQSVETGATFTAVAGNGYPVNTTAQACTATLPASASVGDTIVFVDYARNFDTNALTLDPNSLNFQGNSSPNPAYGVKGQSITITYIDATQGWIPTADDDVPLETPQNYNIDILLVGGGGSGGSEWGGGGGAGGLIYKTGHAITNTITYDVAIGAGGAAQTTLDSAGNNGVDTTWTKSGDDVVPSSVEFTAKGGGGGGGEGGNDGKDGGSGGGGNYATSSLGSETQTSQSGDSGTYGFGNDGGDGSGIAPDYNPGGGGGAGGAGDDGDGTASGDGGVGKDYSAVFANEGDSGWFSSGGGGGWTGHGASQAGSASAGGGTDGGATGDADSAAAAANTGGGSGGGASTTGTSGAGGSGVICFKVLTADYSGTTTGSPGTRTDGSYTLVEFTGDGSYTG